MKSNRLAIWLIVAIAVSVVLLILRTSQPAGPVVVVTDVQTPIATLLPPTRTTTAEDISCKRPYPHSSIWNVPIDWSVAKIHPMNNRMMEAFFADYDWIGSDTSRFTPNLYWISKETPLVPVRLIKYRFRDAFDDAQVRYGEPGGLVWMPLPAHARPAAGTDGQLAVINLETGEEWGLNDGFIDFARNWYAQGIYRYSIHNSGIPPEGFAQRGAGIGQLAGIVRRCEVERGRIEHAVTLAYDYPCKPEVCQQNGWRAVIPPFRKTDGRGESQFDIPEGARIAIRPEISRTEIIQACAGIRGCEIWVLNMQEYGGFIVDNSDHPKTYAEGDTTAQWPPSMWTLDMLRNIPKNWYVVLDWNTPTTEVH
jgi:hypothetical protein